MVAAVFHAVDPPVPAFHELLLSEKRFLGKVTFHYAAEPDAIRAYLRRDLWHRPDNAESLLCGPRPFMDLVENTAAATWPPEAVNLEYFSADAASLSGPRDTFTVKLARTGGDYVYPGGQEHRRGAQGAWHRDRNQLRAGCLAGTCLTGVLEGEPDHRDVLH